MLVPDNEGGGSTIRGEACLAPKEQEQVRRVLDRRRKTAAEEKVCHTSLRLVCAHLFSVQAAKSG